MQIKRFAFSLVLGLGLALTLLWACGNPGAAAPATPDTPPTPPLDRPAEPTGVEWTVCLAGPPTCDFGNIQDAVINAGPDDLIKVAQGNYTDLNQQGGITQVLYVDKDVTVRGGYTTTNWTNPDPQAHPTVLDAGGGGRALYLTGNAAPSIEGLILTGGDATGLDGDPWGCWEAGGGAYVNSAAATISGCLIYSNTSPFCGGGVHVAGAWVDVMGNRITSNTVQFGTGGGVHVNYGEANLRDNQVLNNTAFAGGGLYIKGSYGWLSRNTIQANQADDGGGLYLDDSSLRLDNHFILENESVQNGSGLYLQNTSLRLRHTTLSRNTGGDGSGLYLVGASNATLTNTILVSQYIGVHALAGTTATLQATLWGSGVWANTYDAFGAGLVVSDTSYWGQPDFVDDQNGDYHIGPASDAIDAGLDARLTDDVDGAPRPANLGYDLGADEHPGAVLWPKQTPWQRGFNAGQILTYTVRVPNVGVISAANVRFTDTLPLYQRPVYADSPQGPCSFGGGWGGWVTCDWTTIDPGSFAQVILAAEVTSTQPGPLPFPMRNTVQVRGDNAANQGFDDLIMHDCHLRVGGTDYTYVQGAVDAALDGDLVMAAGLCSGPDERNGQMQLAYLDKNLTLRGGYSPDFSQWAPEIYSTTLDAFGAGRAIFVTGGVSPTLAYLRISKGDAMKGGDVGWNQYGGGVGVMQAAVTLSHCHLYGNVAHAGGGLHVEMGDATLVGSLITDNEANDGGGLALKESDITLTDNTIADNLAYSYGGGLFLVDGQADLNGDVISRNVALSGGGLYAEFSHLNLDGCTVVSNTVPSSGGGLALYYNNSLTLTNSLVRGNTADFGGGIDMWIGQATFSGNTFAENVALSGGGLMLSEVPATLIDNVFENNQANGTFEFDGGGGLYSHSPLTLIHNTFSGNTAANWGGGLYLFENQHMTLLTNTIQANSAGDRGGGVYLEHCTATLRSNVVQDNSASSGSGLYATASVSLTLINNVVAQNLGAGLWVEGMLDAFNQGLLLHNTIADNDEVGVYVGTASSLRFTNTIIGGPGQGITVTAGSTATLDHTLWYSNPLGWWGGAGYITTTADLTGDPAFVLPGDYHIRPESAAVDVGVDAGVTHDIDGQPRPYGLGFDVGADEQGCLTLTSVLIDGPMVGDVDLPYLFLATISPTNASPPVTYTWGATGQSQVITTVDFVEFTWLEPGVKTLTVTAENCGAAPVSATHTITISGLCQGLDSVVITGPTEGGLNTPYIFDTIVEPVSATLPITYTWGATEQSTLVTTSNVVAFTWVTDGLKAISVTAENCAGVPVSATYAITIAPGIPAYSHVISPVAKSLSCASIYTLTNTGTGLATMQHEFFNQLGLSVHSFADSLDVGASQAYSLTDVGLLPTGYEGYVVVTADQPFTYTLDPCPQPITPCTPLRNVGVAGPMMGYTNTAYTLHATVTPTDASEPISYVWAPAPDAGQGTAAVTYTWTTTGVKTVAVAASNCGGSVSGGHAILIGSGSAISVGPSLSQTLTYAGEEDYTVTLEFPAGAVSTDTTIIYAPILSPTEPVSPGLRFVGGVFELDAYQGGQYLPGFGFGRAVTLTIGYSEEGLGGIDEGSMALYRWVVNGWQIVGRRPGEGQTLDEVNNLLQARLLGLSKFTRMGAEPEAGYQLFLPVVIKND